MRNEKFFTFIIPVFNGETTLPFLINSINELNYKEYINEIIFLDSNSSDNTISIIEKFKNETNLNVNIIYCEKSIGLGGKYNIGINKCNSKYFILFHQDIVINNKDALKILLDEFEKDTNLFALYSNSYIPHNIWENNNFWLKLFLDPQVDKPAKNLFGRFDCYVTDMFKNTLQKFDDIHFRTAGEDADIQIRTRINKLKIKCNEIEILHFHDLKSNYTFFTYLKKNIQYSESLGPFINKHGIIKIIRYNPEYLIYIFRNIMIFGLLIPYIQIFILFFIIIYSILYTRNIYFTNEKLLNKILVPFLNIFILFPKTFYFIKSIILNRQKVDYRD